MSTVLVPHFDLPMRLVGSSLAVVEQDTLDDIANCVVAALGTRIGERVQVPYFGTEDLTFLQQPFNQAILIGQLATSEPRATTMINQHPGKLDRLIDQVTAEVSPSGATS